MNYYKILGLSKTATQEEIKKRYKKLVLEHHPDKGGNSDKFREIQEAYEVLSNDNLKTEYDKNYQSIKMNDTYYKLNITLREAYMGINKTIKINTKHICEKCKKHCRSCNGLGIQTVELNFGPFRHIQKMGCRECNGMGVKIEKTQECKCEMGFFREEKTIVFEIERGDIISKTYKINGLGEQPKRDWDIPGDVIIEIAKEECDSQFTRRGYDLLHKIQIKFTDAIVGVKLSIHHYTKMIEIDTSKYFGIIVPNKEYIIKGEGIEYKEKKGDLIIKFEFIYPETTQYVSENTKSILKGIFDKIEW